MRYRIISLMAVFLLVLGITGVYAGSFTEVPSGQLSVQHDDGNGTVYKSLPENYAKLKKLSLDDAVIVSGTGYSIVDAQTGGSDRGTRPHLVWTGKISFGGDIRTSTTDAVLKNNSLPSVTLKFPDGAELSDGRTADVIVTLDNISVKVTKSFNSKIKDTTTVKVLVAASDAQSLSLVTSSPKTAVDKWDYTNTDKSSSAGAAYRLRTTIRLTEHASGSTVGNTISTDEYPSMLVEFKDLDVRDYTLRSGYSYTKLWNGTYAEGIEMTTGWGNPVALAPMGDGILNQSLVEKQSVNGNTKIKGKGSQFQELENVTGSVNDTKSFYSGFAAPVSPAGFSFYWTGSIKGGSGTYSNMGTAISGQPTVAVKAMRSEGGSLGNDETGVRSGLDNWYNNTHLMNSAATYEYAPEEGWVVDYLKVDGEEQELTEEERINGGAYVFELLNKDPVAERVLSDGKILDAEESSYYTIEVRYIRKPTYITQKTSNKQQIKNLSTEPVTYTIKCTEESEEAIPGTHQIKDDLAHGILKLVPDTLDISVTEGSSYTVDKQDNEGVWVTFESARAEGIRPEITITYQATVNWDKYTGGSIINTADVTHEMEVVNNLIISKSVTGNLGDLTKRFMFRTELSGLAPDTEYSIANNGADFVSGSDTASDEESGVCKTDSEGFAIMYFTMKDDDSVSFEGLPAGTSFKVEEEASDHDPSYVVKQGGSVIKQDSGEEGNDLSTGEVTMGDNGSCSVEFTNDRNIAPVTGKIAAMTGLWSGCLAGVIALLCILIWRKHAAGN